MRGSDPGLEKQAVEPFLRRVTKILKSDAHMVVAGAGLCPIGAKQPVPPWRVEAEIAVGLARPAPCLFRNIAWGSAEVMAATRARACAAGLRWHELPPLFDLDVTEDYERALALGLVAQDDGTAQIHLQCGGTVS